MRALVTRLIVFVVIGMMTPGLVEAAENLWHIVVAGHAAHALEAGGDHAPDGDEHGCSGTFHLCGCHYSSPSNLPLAVSVNDLEAGVYRVYQSPPLCESPDLAGLFRPPRS